MRPEAWGAGSTGHVVSTLAFVVSDGNPREGLEPGSLARCVPSNSPVAAGEGGLSRARVEAGERAETRFPRWETMMT